MTFNRAARDRAVELLEAGVSPAAIIDAITVSSFDPDAELRQYGVTALAVRLAAFRAAGLRRMQGIFRAARDYTGSGDPAAAQRLGPQVGSLFLNAGVADAAGWRHRSCGPTTGSEIRRARAAR